MKQRTLNYFGRGSTALRLTSCLTGWDSAACLFKLDTFLHKFGQIQTSQTGGQLYSDTSPYKVSECSLIEMSLTIKTFPR